MLHGTRIRLRAGFAAEAGTGPASPAKSITKRRRVVAGAAAQRALDAKQAIEVGDIPAPGQPIGERELAAGRESSRSGRQ